MWIFTQDGFLSVVAHRALKDSLMVRARDRQSLQNLESFAAEKIAFTANADYAWRLTITREDFSKYLAMAVETIDYDNFKNEMHFARPDFDDALMDVWVTMHKVEDERAVKRYDAL